MQYRKSEAKEYAKTHITGLWGASFTTYAQNYRVDEDAWRFNLRHYIDNLQLEGLFVCGTMAEYWYLSVAERKRILQLAVEEANGNMLIMPYTYDLVVDNELEMIRYAEDVGADLVVTSQPAFPVGDVPNDEGVFRRFKYISERTNIGIAIFNAPYQGYFMSPQLASRIADLPNIVAIKNMGDFGALRRMRIACGEKVLVCDPIETQWWTNMTVYGQQALFATYFLHLYQSKHLRLVQQYTDLYRKGEVAKALEACKRLEAVRRACDSVMFHGKMRASHKYWSQCIGMAAGDGRVRLPQAELTVQEKQAIRAAAETTELTLSQTSLQKSASA